MVKKSEDIIAKHREAFDKLLKATEQEYPKATRETLFKIAYGRLETWNRFLSDTREDMPLFILFKDLGELSNLKIQGVKVDYMTEPSIILECIYKGTKRTSFLNYDEVRKELDFALKNKIAGVEKLRSTMERLEMELIDIRKIRKVGNSIVVSIPESIASLFDLKVGDYISFIYRFGEVKLKKARPEV